jgi:acyloxyacyl hydrolase
LQTIHIDRIVSISNDIHISVPIIELLESKQTPDVICRELGLCKGWEQCQLYPGPNKPLPASYTRTVRNYGEDWWQTFFEPFIRTFANHTALIDHDGDSYSTTEGFRGTKWRGKDCNDNDASIHAGRKYSNKTVRTTY